MSQCSIFEEQNVVALSHELDELSVWMIHVSHAVWQFNRYAYISQNGGS